MSTTIVLLRGINVGGRAKLPMADLRAAIEAAGGRCPATYVNSGNAVCGGGVDAGALGEALERAAGVRPKAMLLDGEVFRAALAANPFPTEDHKALHLYFLEEPSATRADDLDAAKGAEERWHLTDGVFYLYTPRYLSGSALAPRLEKLLGVAATGRNWRTCCKLCEMLEAR